MCSMNAPTANFQSNCKKKGFALVLALALLSLVFLLVISLVNLVSTDLSLVEARKEKVLAQAHARMGMKIAIGEIQKHLGPDMRISATADLLDERIESGKNYEDSTYIINSNPNNRIDLNEDDRINTLPYGQRYWTGVWKHRGRDRGVDDSKLGARPLPENFETGDNVPEQENAYPTKNSEFDPHPAIEVAWLVSGNEGFDKKLYFGNNPYQPAEFVEIPDGNLWDKDQYDKGRTFVTLGGGSGTYGNDENAWEDYTMALQNSSLRGTGFLPEYNHPIFELPDPQVSDEVEWLLVSPLLKKDFDKNNFDLGDSTTWENALSSEPVKARKTRVQHEDEANDESQYGAYAYWVGDEGVKTKVSVQNPFKPDFDLKLRGERDTAQIQKDNLSVATEPNLTFSVNSGPLLSGFGIDWEEEATTKNKKKDILSLDTLSELSDTKSEISAHYHSLTTDSFGVLSDVRTGGLKRDLSSAFANEEDWDEDFLKFDALDWSDDFSNYIYKQRIYYMKSVPMKDNAPENEWNTASFNQPLLEEMSLLGGPRWSVLGSFHNLYLAKNYDDITPDNFPRIVGDNNVLFNHLQGYGVKPRSPGNVDEVTNTKKLIQRFNYFEGIGKRPEPKNHPIQPVLVEFKYSQQPTLHQGFLGLAAYPSVAFWNPYNVPIKYSKKIYIEIPMNSSMRFGDPVVYDLYKKWLFHIRDEDAYKTAHPLNDPNQESQGGPSFDDVNGNGKQDPGERSFYSPNNGGGAPPFYPRSRHWFSGGWDIDCDWKRNTCAMNSSFDAFNKDPITGDIKYPRRQFDGLFLKSSDSDSSDYLQSRQNRHLLMEIPKGELELQPGEKLHFVPAVETVFTHTALQPKIKGTVFVKIPMKKLSGVESTPIYFLSGNSEFKTIDPVMIWYECGNVKGVHSNAREYFDQEMIKGNPSNLEYPKGITIYSENPEAIASPRIIGKINKNFDFRIGGTGNGAHRLDIAYAGKLDNLTTTKLLGHGFRIRYKLPGKTDKITFEQFNLRALIHSNQDGYGDNWEFEINPGKYSDGNFNGVDFFTPPDPNDYAGNEAMDLVIKDITAFTLNSPNLDGNSLIAAIPKLQNAQNSIGFFHENQSMGSMEGVKNAVMFEIPDSPMLSIFQFRHANLNNYSHGPSYALGNSYASTQVARYRTWGKVRAISEAPVYPGTDIKHNNKVQKLIYQDPTIEDRDYFNWKNKIVVGAEGVPIRDLYAGKDHQNVTLDHSFYINYALMDGYFMSGLGIGSAQWEQADPKHFDPGVRFLPFRNPRLIPYLREAEWKSTSYSDGKKDVDENDEEFRYQTLSSDLLVDGAFNVNSTSVDAWASQLSSLRGQAIKTVGEQVQDYETPIPRFLEYKLNDSWNMLRKLSDEEVNLLAHKIVEQVKLRGPFLSFADFVNRRLQGNVVNLYLFPFDEWNESDKKETRSSTLGLRGAVQAAIAEAGLNQGEFSKDNSESSLPIPEVPSKRFGSDKVSLDPIEELWPLASELKLIPSEFGIHAISENLVSYEIGGNSTKNYLSYPVHQYDDLSSQYEQAWGRGIYIDGQRDLLTEWYPPYHKQYGSAKPKKVSSIDFEDIGKGDYLEMKIKFLKYDQLFSYGEAPENLLAVENVATGANKPGWVMQSDLLSPLAPVTSVRSDTFVIRVMGESLQKENDQTQSKSWIEVTVQRVPDYVKSDYDNPHHRPHEPFEDRNFNGYWDGLLSEPEHWIDYDQDSVERNFEGIVTQKNVLDKKGSYPDLASDNDTFADGLKSDLSINKDEDEEVVSEFGTTVSHMGINQRFGRKFKIIKFRWLKAQDV